MGKAKKIVVCSDCVHLKQVNLNTVCGHRSNIKEHITISPSKKSHKIEYVKKCTVLNKNNDCKKYSSSKASKISKTAVIIAAIIFFGILWIPYIELSNWVIWPW